MSERSDNTLTPAFSQGERELKNWRLHRRTGVQVHNRIETFQRIGLRPLEGVAPNDRAKTATVTNRPALAKHLVIPCSWATGEDENAPAIEARLDQLRISRTRDMVSPSLVLRTAITPPYWRGYCVPQLAPPVWLMLRTAN